MLELSVGDGGQVVEVDELDKIVEEPLHPIRRGRDEGGIGGAGPPTTDPVLLSASHARETILRRTLEERPMDVEEVVESERTTSGAHGRGPLHRPDVAEDGSGHAVGSDWLIGG